MFLVENRLCFQ